LGEVKTRIPVKRLGLPHEIADAVLFLAAPGSAYITGQVLTVDGGLTA
jgi:3-oxoacyl-[acyl-carrier protein] reductase